MSDILGTAGGTGGDIFGTAAFEAIDGGGTLALGNIAVAASGVVEAPRVGSGALTLQTFSASGSGSVRVVGTGGPTLSTVQASGSGNSFANIPGTGNAFLSVVTASGSGSMSPPVRSGSGVTTLQAVQVSGAGAIVARATGDVVLSEVAVTGSGVAFANIPGTGAAFVSEVAVSGAGNVIVPALPVINNGGPLTITLPFGSQAAAKDYPAIVSWVNLFYSDVTVSNTLYGPLLVSQSPITVYFSATNQFGTTTVSQVLTILVAADTGTLTPNEGDFRLQFPYFNDTIEFPYATVQVALGAAQCHIKPTSCGRLRGTCGLRAIYLMAAHLLYIQQQAATGGTAGVITGSAVDKVSVSFATPPAKSQWQFWLSSSPYGMELQGLLAQKSVGGFYIPGSAERSGFRKAGGRF